MNRPEAHAGIFVVSAPSGTGKTTLNRRLVTEHPQVEISVSFTTRRPRLGEVDGVHYHFVDKPGFHALINSGRMLEHAEVFGTLYGTSRDEITRLQKAGKTALLEIDVQGWQQAHQALPEARSIFILPPSIEALWQRLEGRGTEEKGVRWRRLMTARAEIASGNLYDFFIVNHTLEAAYKELESLVIHGESSRIGRDEGSQICAALLAEFDHSPWLHKLSSSLADK